MSEVSSVTLAEVVVHGGEVVHETYGPDTDPSTTLISWSTAKSVTHALVGLLVADGRLDLMAPAPGSLAGDDARRTITLASSSRCARACGSPRTTSTPGCPT